MGGVARLLARLQSVDGPGENLERGWISKSGLSRSTIVAGSSLSEVAEGMQGVSMSCRRNLKKEKRHRNEVMARQFRKPTLGRFRGGRGRGGGRAASSAQDEADSEWLDQIYGQHTIYRRDQNMAVGKTVAPKEEEANA